MKQPELAVVCVPVGGVRLLPKGKENSMSQLVTIKGAHPPLGGMH